MARFLILRLEAPLMAFGDVMIDAIGPVRDTPAASTIVGLLANALGVRREQGTHLARLQERLVFGCRVDRHGERFTEFQTARLGADDRGWTTRGRVDERAGGANTYRSPHIRYRDFHADACVTVALRLLDEIESPTLDDVAHALDAPARPIFLGRKSCLPAAPLVVTIVDALTAHDALRLDFAPVVPSKRRGSVLDESMAVMLPVDEPCPGGFRAVRSSERRDWIAGVHTGEVTSYRGQVRREDLVAVGEPR